MSKYRDSFSDFERNLMQRLLVKAAEFKGRTLPNPMVAAAIYKDEQVISYGVHRRAGTDHAEVDAIKNASQDIKGASMMVTLEPCTHHGRTGPCADAIIHSGIKDLIYASDDPFHKVKENPAKAYFSEHGIGVRSGLLSEEARALNKHYYYFHEHKRPYVIMKAAMTLDACLAKNNGDSKYLSCEDSLRKVHELRAQVSAVMIGRNTLIQDNARCNVRYGQLAEGQKGPACIVMGRQMGFDASLQLFSTGAKSIYVTQKKHYESAHPFDELWPVLEDSNAIDWASFFEACYSHDIQSILLEGGSELYSSMLSAKLVNEAYFFLTPKLMGSNQGIGLCQLDEVKELKDLSAMTFSNVEFCGKDILVHAVF